jgi:hypothetical protein
MTQGEEKINLSPFSFMSLRLPLFEQVPHDSGLIQPTWRHRTTGMAAGLTDHVRAFRELLAIKFEPIRNRGGSG